jgi:glycosyltransferase involved in cell wall biosynthesis
MQPTFSVVIPLYNKEKYIEQTLESIAAQTFTNFEIIVINDGSTDKSLDVVQTFFQKNNHFKHTIISRENKGLSATRNEGAFLSKGKLIAFIDADDCWANSFLKTIFNLAETYTQASVFGTDYYECDLKQKRRPAKNLAKHLDNTSFIVTDFFAANLFQPIVCQSSICIKKDVFTSVRFNENIDFAEDIDLYLQLFTSNKSFAYLLKPLSYVRVNLPGQITQNPLDNKRIPDFNWYENKAKTNNGLKMYLDYHRYTFASKYKFYGNAEAYKKMISALDHKNLNSKQRFLLRCPRLVFRQLIVVKQLFLKKNIRWTTY